MPRPKRTTTTTATNTNKSSATTKTVTTRRSKLAKENNISAAQELLIRDVWNTFRITTENIPDDDQDEEDDEAGGETLEEALEQAGKEGVVRKSDIPQILQALGLLPGTKEGVAEIMEVFEGGGPWVGWEGVVGVAALRMNLGEDEEGEDEEGDGVGEEERRRREVEEAFRLFTKEDAGGGGEGRRITLQDLREVAKVVKEDVSDEVLKAMIVEANKGVGGGWQGGVGREGFRDVMIRAGVLR